MTSPLRLPSIRSIRRCKIRASCYFVGIAVLLLSVIYLVKEPRLHFDDFTAVRKLKHKTQNGYIDKHGIHVVVGHYIADQDIEKNLTEEILNSNDFDPEEGAGANGMPVQVPPWKMSHSKYLHKINQFNIVASDKIPLNRTLPDIRKNSCRKKKYVIEKIPTTSVIIVFHNEAWSTLLRTVHSVINRSPASLLTEIILVDDASQRTFLKKPLSDYVLRLSINVRVFRTEARVGLIKARLLGARHAKGKVLTFLDAHCEVTHGWIEPLLSSIGKDRTKIVCPLIDIIDENTFQYVRSFELHWGAFNWHLHFRWYSLSHNEIENRRKDPTLPYKTPAMAGGLFSIDKKYFYDIGAYDPDMEIWGGENLEMSFRTWMCGGSVEIAPCSHVGHVFRKSSPYSFPGVGGVGGILYRNLARVASVWMDEWANFFFKYNPEAERERNLVNVTQRKNLRNSLNCKSFRWYLDNIWKNNFLPGHDKLFGKIVHVSSVKCIQRPQYPGGSTYSTGAAVLKKCVIEPYAPQTFVYHQNGYIMTDENVCLDAPDFEESSEPRIRITPCIENKRQKWIYDKNDQNLIHESSHLCLDLPSKENPETLSLQPCVGLSRQKWLFQIEDWMK